MYRRLEIQWGFRVFLEELVMTGGAVAFRSLHVRGVIEGNVPILGCRR
jgi:hypothetical protein